jgi:hypothetical protein
MLKREKNVRKERVFWPNKRKKKNVLADPSL